MKREYFGMLFIFLSVAAIFLADEFFGEAKVTHWLSTFVVVWIMLAFGVGQYSMRFPKAF